MPNSDANLGVSNNKRRGAIEVERELTDRISLLLNRMRVGCELFNIESTAETEAGDRNEIGFGAPSNGESRLSGALALHNATGASAFDAILKDLKGEL